MKNKSIYDSNNGLHLKELQDMGYKYIVKGVDNFLSGWGSASGKKHLQLIACKTIEEREKIYKDLLNDNTFTYVNWYYITDKRCIYNTIRGKSYTIRNDWTRCFK